MKRFLFVMLFCIPVLQAQTPLTDANIHVAVDLWLSDQPLAETTYGHISNWNTSNVTDMSNLFYGANDLNDPIGNWDVSNVTTMNDMFRGASSFNQPIGNWDVSSVTDMSDLFRGATNFNQEINNWDVGNVTNMGAMFMEATAFNQPIGNWDVYNVTNMSYMFNQSNFDQDIRNWNVSNVTNMANMFNGTFLSLSTYDALLITWASLPSLQSNIVFNAGSSNFCNAESARNTLNMTYNWSITDGGLDCSSITSLTNANINQAVHLWFSNQSMAEATYGHISFWDTSQVTDMSSLFFDTNDFLEFGFNEDLSNWDVSNVTDMSTMFHNSDIPLGIGNWDVGNVTNMHGMFEETGFNENVDISNWDVGSATDMSQMFANNQEFNQPIGNWDVSNVINMTLMFESSEFNQPLGNWDVSSVIDMSGMFDSSEFNQPLGSWDVSNVTDMSSMFQLNQQFNQDINTWDVSNVMDMRFMFFYAQNFNQPLDNWDVNSVTNMSGMFQEAINFNQPIGNWDVSSVTNMAGMFIFSAFNQPIDTWNVGSVTKMNAMFSFSEFNQPLSNWDVSSVSDMSYMFQGTGTTNFNQDISGWDVSNVTDMSYMFFGNRFNQPLENWDVSNVTNMSSMFAGDNDVNLFNQDISNWNVNNVTNMSGMFSRSSFNQPIGNWHVGNVGSMDYMFYESGFDQNIGNWDVSNVNDMSLMFSFGNLSNSNYDSLLIGWASLPTLQPNVNFDVASNYCSGESSRNVLINTYGWTITDSGLDCSTMTPITDANIHEAVDLWISDQPTAETTYGHISNWDTSNVTDMSNLFNFYEAENFNGDISNWDVSNVTDMSYMFAGINADIGTSIDPDISGWNVSSVTTMKGMFKYNYMFNQSIGNWDVSNVTDISEMFMMASNFNQPIGNWDVGNVTTMASTFYGYTDYYADSSNMEEFEEDNRPGTAFNQNISGWNVSSVLDMSRMFQNCQFNQPIGNWNVSNVTTMQKMFRSSLFNQDIGSWNVGNVTDMSEMFRGADVFDQPIDNWDVGNVTTMRSMFGTWECDATRTSVFNQPLNNWDVSSVSDMSGMFTGASFNQDISSWDVSNVTNMSLMFGGYSCGEVETAVSFLLNNYYDNLLTSWSALPNLQPNVIFNVGTSTYCNGESSKNFLVNNYGWVITDGGLDCSNIINCVKTQDDDVFMNVTNNIDVSLDVAQDIKGFQFDITFPDGFIFNPGDITKLELPDSYQLSCSSIGNNIYRVIGFSFVNEIIPAGIGNIVTLPTNIDSTTPVGDYQIPITNIILSDENNVNVAYECQVDGILSLYDYPLGDANGDYNVNILDILVTIDFIFDNIPSVFYYDLVDLNLDQNINILDILEIQDIILNPEATSEENSLNVSLISQSIMGSNYLVVEDKVITPGSSDILEVNLNNQDVVKGMEFNFTLPQGIIFDPSAIVGTTRVDGFTISAQEISPNVFKVLIFSLTSGTISPGSEAILNLPITVGTISNTGVYPIALTDVIISDINNNDIATTAPEVGELSIAVLGISETDDVNIINIYPNPSRDIIYIDSSVKGGYQIYDVTGKSVDQKKLLIGTNKLNISTLSEGVYLLEINHGSRTLVKRIVKI